MYHLIKVELIEELSSSTPNFQLISSPNSKSGVYEQPCFQKMLLLCINDPEIQDCAAQDVLLLVISLIRYISHWTLSSRTAPEFFVTLACYYRAGQIG